MAPEDSQDSRNRETQRGETNESLRRERDKIDARASDKRDAVEIAADEVVRLARERADEIMQIARDDADRGSGERPAIGDGDTDRDLADDVLQQERSSEDARLEDERARRRRYLAAFMAVEREATDQDLIEEREHADTMIASRDEFLGTVSHELRSLLEVLALNAARLNTLAPAGPAGEPIRKQAGTNQRTVARMNRLIGDLLDATSIEAGKLEIRLDTVAVAELLRDTLDAFEPIAAAKQIRIVADAPAAGISAHLDGERILQVLANLVSNAIKFTPAGGQVSIEIRVVDDELHHAVSDTGIGIPEAELATVFERFHQVSADRRGLGLGLYIARHIVEAHGGRLWAESDLGAGSTFRFVVPRSGVLAGK